MLPLLPAAQTSAFLHGASAFTTVRIQPTQSRHGAALLWPEHLARLSGTCAFLGLPAPAPDLPALPAGCWLLRVTVTEEGTFHTFRPLNPGPRPAGGVSIVLTSWQTHPQLAAHKTGNYLPYRLAGAQATVAGAFEGWLTDAAGNVVDGSRTSPVLEFGGLEFGGLEFGGRLVVPSGGLPGTTRTLWLSGQDWEERPVHVSELGAVTRAWICGAGVGVVPVAELNGRRLVAEWPSVTHPALLWPS